MKQPGRVHPARLGEETAATYTLRNLPTPAEKLYAAVYKFRDLTGQYKLTETGSNFSTAVTQGTTNILLKALEESGWFVPIERENVSNLLNERKIIRSSMAQFKSEADNLPPLLFAGIIMEGGVVSYDANIMTGGAGLKYFGTGGSTQYRQDRITVYLRAVATKTGKIIKTIYTSKTILSQSVDGGLFRYVSFKRLLEAETGFTTTEPTQLAVTEAIEKAVHSLVVEGIRDSLWTASPKAKVETRGLLNAYARERIDTQTADLLGSAQPLTPPMFVVQPYGSFWQYHGDYSSPSIKTGFGLSVDAYVSPHWAIRLNAGMGRWATKYYLDVGLSQADVGLLYRMLPYHRFTPLFYAGGGYIRRNNRSFNETTIPSGFVLNAGTGLEYRLQQHIGFRATLEFHQPFTDALDGRVSGARNDYHIQGNVGLVFAIGHHNNPLLKARISP